MSTAVLHFPTKKKAHGSRRARTVRSGQAKRVIAELRSFYGSQSRLASAFGVTRDTVRSWSAGTAPARPRVELLERAELLLGLCKAARRYLAADRQVGDWTLVSSPSLQGHSPAQVLGSHGRAGLEVLLAEMATIAPPSPAGPVEMPSVEELRESLAAGVDPEALARIEQIVAAESPELSDAQLDAQLREAKHTNG